jgi:hypothetical protein
MNTDIFISLLAFSVLALLWIGFGAALLFDRQFLERAWRKFRSGNIFIQLFVGVLVLPVVLGLWVWQTHWPVWLRLTLVTGLAWMTLYTFFPRFLFG